MHCALEDLQIYGKNSITSELLETGFRKESGVQVSEAFYGILGNLIFRLHPAGIFKEF